jgi:hypothetical protein
MSAWDVPNDEIASALGDLRSRAEEPHPPKWSGDLVDLLEHLLTEENPSPERRTAMAGGLSFLVMDDIPLTNSDLGARLLRIAHKLRGEPRESS